MSFRPVNYMPSQAAAGDNNASVSAGSHLASHDNTSRLPVNNTSSYPLQKQMSSNSDSQATVNSTASTESTRIFTPSTVERTASTGVASSGHDSSQESQLLQLSQVAAAQEKMPDVGVRSSVKRTADGAVKDSRTSPTASPNQPSSHSRNVSGVSIVSTASSRATEVNAPATRLMVLIPSLLVCKFLWLTRPCLQLSSELKTRLSYAMLKVHKGWQSCTIDEVENLASSAGSPASSNSTLPGGVRSSASPQIQTVPRPAAQTAHGSTASERTTDAAWRGSSTSPRLPSASDRVAARLQDVPSLAPPVSIQPDRSETNARRNSNAKYTPAFLTPRSHHDSPQTPAVPSHHVSPSMATSPPSHNNREKDAMEALLFMSSPGNSANLKSHYPSSQPTSSLRNGATSVPSMQRTALPTSAPKRKSLPNGRPAPSPQPPPTEQSPKKRVGFGRASSTLSEMDIDDPTSPRRHAAYVRPAAPPAQKANGAMPQRVSRGRHSLPASRDFGRAPRARSELTYERLDEVLDRVAREDDSSESDVEIELPVRRDEPGMRI